MLGKNTPVTQRWQGKKRNGNGIAHRRNGGKYPLQPKDMRRREINIFSISFLDLLSGALGAVLILFIIIPKMTNESPQTAQNQQQQNTETENDLLRERLEQTRRQLLDTQQELEQVKRNTSDGRMFGMNAQLGAVIVWPENIDVDLYVKNLNNGDVCFFGKRETTFGSLMEDVTSRDSRDDDRYELFYQHRIIPGRYLIYVNIYMGVDLSHTDSATVDGYVVIFPGTGDEQKINFRQIRLTRRGENIAIGTLTVTTNNITLEQ